MNDYLNIVIRTVSVYAFIIIAIRLMGKKELSQLSVIDLVFIMLLSNAVQNSMVGENVTLEGGLIAAASLFVFNFILKRVFYKSKFLSRFIQGSPVILIHDGKVIEKNIKRERFTRDELLTAAREHGVASLDDINLAILETDGTISILSKDYQCKSRKNRPSKIIDTGE